MSVDESLRTLELLMQELYSSNCSNDRRRQITSLLSDTMLQKDAWRMSLAILEKTTSTSVCMFCFNVLEYCVKNDWLRLSEYERRGVTNAVEAYLAKARNHANVDNILIKKAVVLWVHIARFDWPHDMPDFHLKVMNFLSSMDTLEFGFMVIETWSQEMIVNCDDVSGTRKCEVRDLVKNQLPEILMHASKVLIRMLDEKYFFCDKRFPNLDIPLPPESAESISLVKTILKCLLHLFSWIPLSDMITSQILSSIFRCSVMGCLPLISDEKVKWANVKCRQSIEDIGIIAMNCINELMERNCIPRHFESYLLEMFRQTYTLLKIITCGNSETCEGSSSDGGMLAELSPDYLGKFTEFLSLFMSKHFGRFESNETFPVLEFLELLKRYTFLQMFIGLSNYFLCLGIWNSFLEYVHLQCKSKHGNRVAILSRYKPIIASLTYEIFQKSQFSHNQTFLDELEDEDLEAVDDFSGDKIPEYCGFLHESFETLHLIGQLFPNEILTILQSAFYDNFNAYMAIEPSNVYAHEHQTKKLHCLLRDLSSLMQMLGRMNDQFVGESYFLSRVELCAALFEKIVILAEFASNKDLYIPSTNKASAICRDFTYLHSENLLAIIPFASWLSEMLLHSKSSSDFVRYVHSAIQRIFNLIESVLFRKDVPTRIVISASRLLLSMCTSLRSNYIFSNSSFKLIFEKCANADEFLAQLPFLAVLNMYKSISSYLLLDWIYVSEGQDNQIEQRNTMHVTLLSPFMQQCIDVKTCSTEKMSMSLQILSAVIEDLDTCGSARSRRSCVNSLNPLIASFSDLIRYSSCDPDICHKVLVLIKTVARVLLNQLQKDNLQSIARVLFSLFDGEECLTSALQASHGIEIVITLLDILELLASRQVTAKSSLPDIVHLVCKCLHPKLYEFTAIECLMKVYELLREILLSSMSFFFKANRLHGALNLSTKSVESDDYRKNMECLHPEEFRSVMEIVAQSFFLANLETFSYNLQTMVLVNERYKFFSYEIFSGEMIRQFLSIFFNDLISGFHDSLKEDVFLIIHSLALSDWEVFHNDYLPSLTCSLKDLTNEQIHSLCYNFDKSEDSPSFTRNLIRYVGDVKYFQRCNKRNPSTLSVNF